MSARPPHLQRPPAERAAAWIVTGPLGHLYSVAVDLGLYAARRLAGRS